MNTTDISNWSGDVSVTMTTINPDTGEQRRAAVPMTREQTTRVAGADDPVTAIIRIARRQIADGFILLGLAKDSQGVAIATP